jgi:hypothetical protein
MPDPQPQVPDRAPDWGYAYRQWPKTIEDKQELRRLHPAPGLRYAIDHGWQPGLYLAEDLVLPEPPPQARRACSASWSRPRCDRVAAGPQGWACDGLASQADSVGCPLRSA